MRFAVAEKSPRPIEGIGGYDSMECAESLSATRSISFGGRKGAGGAVRSRRRGHAGGEDRDAGGGAPLHLRGVIVGGYRGPAGDRSQRRGVGAPDAQHRSNLKLTKLSGRHCCRFGHQIKHGTITLRSFEKKCSFGDNSQSPRC